MWGGRPLRPKNSASSDRDEHMLLSQYVYTMDDKGRLTIPSRYRDELPPKMVLTCGLDRCLTLYPLDIWQELAQKVTALPFTNLRGRELRRKLFSEAVDIELDKQGRVLIPDRLREHAGLDLSSEVLIVGLYTVLELWNPETWEQQHTHGPAADSEDPAIWEGLNI